MRQGKPTKSAEQNFISGTPGGVVGIELYK
jgi:hypothetical protein